MPKVNYIDYEDDESNLPIGCDRRYPALNNRHYYTSKRMKEKFIEGNRELITRYDRRKDKSKNKNREYEA